MIIRLLNEEIIKEQVKKIYEKHSIKQTFFDESDDFSDEIQKNSE